MKKKLGNTLTTALNIGIFSDPLTKQLKKFKIKHDKTVINEMEKEYYKKYFHTKSVFVWGKFTKKWFNDLFDYLQKHNKDWDFG